jgi:DNA-binding NtrC family response regulator
MRIASIARPFTRQRKERSAHRAELRGIARAAARGGSLGYERGAFTSAQQAKPGQIELASGGVLFLDEVTEMSLPAQAKLLRVQQEREFQRMGGTRPLKANIRLICEGGLIITEHLALQSDRKPFGSDSADLSVAERATIAQVLRDCRGNKSKAAQRLGLSRTQLYSRMRKHGLEEAASA